MMRVYAVEELAAGKGGPGQPTLVAVNGKVYDLSGSKKWIGGRHMARHHAGCDLTQQIREAPHGLDVLDRFDVIGTHEVVPAAPVSDLRATVSEWLDKHPFFRRHPHPAVVHVPVGMAPAMGLFELLALYFGSSGTEWAAFLCLLMILFTLPAALASGYFTWWINYGCARFTIVNWKRRLAWVALAVALSATLLRWTIADPLKLGDPVVAVYVCALLALSGILALLGFLGGRITFPYE
jgi:predicted heme/steroid binding protein/uncharacterized membrane protein